MVSTLLFGVACHGGGDEPLHFHLKRITDSAYTRKSLGGVDVIGQLLAPVIAESHDADCRLEIMRHLRECLSEPKRWQRIYGGLALAEGLLEHGSPELVIEAAHGYHFDLAQKISLLEHFDAAARGCSDKRAQAVVRKKASEVRGKLIPLLQRASNGEILLKGSDTCSAGGTSTSADSTVGKTSLSGSSVDSASEPGTPSAGERPGAAAAFLDAVFSRIKEPGHLYVSQASLVSVAGASHDAGSRHVILYNLQALLSEPAEQQWHRVYSGLTVVEYLMEHGSPMIFTEAAHSLRFSLSQQVWLLQQFEHRSDWRAKNMIRNKACRVYDMLVLRFLSAVSNTEQGASAPLDDAFSPLGAWLAEASCSSAQSSGIGGGSGASSAAASPHVGFSDPGSRLQPILSEGQRGIASQRFFSIDGGAGEIGADVYFTPLPAPAVPSDPARTTLMSL